MHVASQCNQWGSNIQTLVPHVSQIYVPSGGIVQFTLGKLLFLNNFLPVFCCHKFRRQTVGAKFFWLEELGASFVAPFCRP